MTRATRAALWIGGYLVLVMAPVFLLAASPAPAFRGSFWVEFSVALGFASLGMLGMQFLLTARLRGLAAPFGTDILYYFHRYLGFLILGVLGVHAGVFLWTDPGVLAGLRPGSLSIPLTLGVVSFAAVGLLWGGSVARQALGTRYERWRYLHAILAVVAVVAGLAHALGYGTHADTRWSRAFWFAYGMVGVAVLAWVRVVQPLRARRRPWKVSGVRPQPGGVATITLKPEGHPGLSYRAGQFAWLTLNDSPFAMAEHPFSFSSAPGRPDRVEFTIQPIGDFTREAVRVEPGAVAYLEGPHGIFTLEDHPPAPGYVFLAGGIGIAPIMSILRDRAERRETRPLLLIDALRSLEVALFTEELQEIEQAVPLTTVRVVENPPPGWDGEVGRIDRAVLERHLPENRTELHYYICGPKGMQDSLQTRLQEMGVSSSQIHTEVFHWV